MMDRLRPFMPLCQAVLTHLVFSLSDNWTIDCDGVSVSIHDFMRIIKFGRKRGPSLREVALGIVKEAAERYGMTLGEIKALLFVTTLPAPSWMTHGCLGTVEQEAVVIQEWKERVGKLASTSEYEWSGAHQFGPILNKAIEYYDQVVVPDWC